MTAEPPATYVPRFPAASRQDPVRVDLAVVRTASGPVPTDALAVLADEERERAAQFRRAEDAAMFATGRAVARRLLGARLAIPPEDVAFVVPRPGWKPRVPGGDLDVSIAHAAGLVVVALADGVEVGVDVEGGPATASRVDAGLWRTATSPAERTAAGPFRPGAPGSVDAFLRCWARKEAVLKAVRFGLVVPMDGLTIRDDDPPAILETPTGLPAPGEIALLDVAAPAGHRIAVAAVTSRPVVVRDADDGTVLAGAP